MRKLTAFVVLTTTGCHSWRVQSEPAPSVVSERHPKMVRLVLKSGQQVTMTDASVVGDSIVGRLPNNRRDARMRVAVATADVARISTQYTSAVKSVFAVAAIVVAVAVIAGAGSSSAPASSSGTSCSSTGVRAPAA